MITHFGIQDATQNDKNDQKNAIITSTILHLDKIINVKCHGA